VRFSRIRLARILSIAGDAQGFSDESSQEPQAEALQMGIG
jgi:hypothetical protein